MRHASPQSQPRQSQVYCPARPAFPGAASFASEGCAIPLTRLTTHPTSSVDFSMPPLHTPFPECGSAATAPPCDTHRHNRSLGNLRCIVRRNPPFRVPHPSPAKGARHKRPHNAIKISHAAPPALWTAGAQLPLCHRSHPHRPVAPNVARRPPHPPYKICFFLNSFAIVFTTPSITFFAAPGLNESLVPVQINSPLSPPAEYRFVSIRTVVSFCRYPGV